MSRLLLPHEKRMAQPTFKRVAAFMAGFELLTLSAGAWGWISGLPFGVVVPGAFLCGMMGGAFLSVGVHAIRTGYMQRMSTFYRFSERPVTFVMDSLMVIMAIALSAAWPICYSMEELAKQQPASVAGTPHP